MTTGTYLTGRFKWARPQGLIFANEPGVLSEGLYVPQGTEREDFIILSDHNRSPFDFSFERIEDRRRMLNGTMRSFFVADKLNLSVSWDDLPSRSADATPTWDAQGRPTQLMHTVDGGADGAMLLRWYEEHPGPFWVFMSYDKDGGGLRRYQDVVHMYFSSFSHSVVKRGGSTYDFWNVSLGLEEV